MLQLFAAALSFGAGLPQLIAQMVDLGFSAVQFALQGLSSL
jgi:hypothetical protein